MTKRSTLSTALTLGILFLTLTGFNLTVKGQVAGGMEFVATTGSIDLAPNEMLEITVFHKGGGGAVNVHFVQSLWSCACSFGGGPLVRVGSEVAPVLLEPNGAYKRRYRATATFAVKSQSIDILADRPAKVIYRSRAKFLDSSTRPMALTAAKSTSAT